MAQKPDLIKPNIYFSPEQVAWLNAKFIPQATLPSDDLATIMYRAGQQRVLAEVKYLERGYMDTVQVTT